MSSDNKISLRVVVAGQETNVVANINAPLRVVAEHALAATANTGRALSEWEFKDANGKMLDVSRKVGDFQFADGVLLYLTLVAGING
jgi:hypothetical protein